MLAVSNARVLAWTSQRLKSTSARCLACKPSSLLLLRHVRVRCSRAFPSRSAIQSMFSHRKYRSAGSRVANIEFASRQGHRTSQSLYHPTQPLHNRCLLSRQSMVSLCSRCQCAQDSADKLPRRAILISLATCTLWPAQQAKAGKCFATSTMLMYGMHNTYTFWYLKAALRCACATRTGVLAGQADTKCT